MGKLSGAISGGVSGYVMSGGNPLAAGLGALGGLSSQRAQEKAAKGLKGARPTGFTTPGISVTPGGQLTRSAGLQSTLDQLQAGFGTQAGQLAGLRGQVTPGFGALTESAVNAIRNRRRAAIGNLRENLARRRVLGSSFAQDALARAEAEFAQEEAQVRAQTKLQELDVTMNLINQEAAARQQQFNTLLTQSNFEAQLGANVSAGIGSQLSSNAQFEAQLASQEASGLGQLAGMGASLLGMQDGGTGPIGGAGEGGVAPGGSFPPSTIF